MAIRLNWEEPKGVFDEIRVYRTLAPFDSSSVPATPLATLKTGTFYVDQTPNVGVLYYYTLALKIGSDLIISPPQMAIDTPNVGPGPNTVVTGDRKAGWLGNLPQDQLFSNAELSSLVGLGTNTGTSQVWIKGACNGKICFYPTYDVATNVSWQQLYDLGLVYGMDSNGPTGGPFNGSVNQRKVVTKGDYSYLVRLMKFSTTDDWKFTTINPVGFSEVRDVYFKLFNAPGGMSSATYSAPAAGGAWTGDLFSATTTGWFTTAMSGSGSGITLTKSWRPVLELIY